MYTPWAPETTPPYGLGGYACQTANGSCTTGDATGATGGDGIGAAGTPRCAMDGGRGSQPVGDSPLPAEDTEYAS